MRGTEELVTALAGYLEKGGLRAVTAWSGNPRQRPGKAVAAISLRALESEGAGFQNYLGERYDAERGQWEERYGRRMKLTFGLDLSGAGAEDVRKGLDTLRDLLDQGGPEGMEIQEISAGETAYEEGARRYVCPVRAVIWAWAVVTAWEDGTAFLDFEVRGERKT